MATATSELQAILDATLTELERDLIALKESKDSKDFSEQQLHFSKDQQFQKPVLFRQITNTMQFNELNDLSMSTMVQHQACEAVIKNLKGLPFISENTLISTARHAADQVGMDLKRSHRNRLGIDTTPL